MSEVRIIEERREGKKEGKSGMQALAEKEVYHHTQPLPEAEAPPVIPFPNAVVRGLWAGVITGGLVGWFFGYLLQNNLIVVEGWEGLYSMTPLTFIVFWIFMGVAAGILLGGITAILAADRESRPEFTEEAQKLP